MAFASQPTSHSCAHLHRPKVVALKSPTSRTSQSTWNPLKLTGMGTVSARPRDFVSAGSVAACQTTKRFHEISGLISKVLCHHRPILEDPCRSLFVPLDSYYVTCLGYHTQNQMINAFLSWAKYEWWSQVNNRQKGSIHVNNMRSIILHIFQVPPDHELYRLFIRLSKMFTRCALTVNIMPKNSRLQNDSRQGWKRSVTNPGMPGNFRYISVQAVELKMMMKMTTNKDQEAIATTEQNPSVEEEIQRSDYAKSMDKSPKLCGDKAQSSKIQSDD